MSSETSTEAPRLARDAGGAGEAGFQPWQLFTLAGLLGGAIVAFVAGNQPHAVRIALILTVFAAAAIGLAALRTLLPLTGESRLHRPQVIGGRTRAALEREKVLALRAIKELEFDRAMGKVSEKDFQEMSLRLRSRAARILRDLDAGTNYRDEIAREIDRRVASAPSGPVPVEPPAPRDAAGADVPIAPVRSPVTCNCGTANDTDARFCKSCGARLEAA